MAIMTGIGTLYDADENTLGEVAYRIEHDASPGDLIRQWAGEVNFEPSVADIPLEPGFYLLEIADGSRSEIEIEPTGAASGAKGQIAFSGRGELTVQA